MQVTRSNVLIECLLIFSACFIIYLSNGRMLGSGDTVPNSLLALNWLQNHTLHFDSFRDSYLFSIYNGLPYFFTESDNGHLTSVYPIGTAIVSFPIYFVLSIYLKFLAFTKTHIIGTLFTFDITNIAFEPYRQILEKITATTTTAFTVTIFYIATRLKFQFAVALITTFIYAFATNTWVTSSQALWQHSATNLVLVSLLLCLLKANRTEKLYLKLLLSVAGVLCALLALIRPTNILFTLVAILYVLFTYRKLSIYLLLGLPLSLLGISWNFYYFGNILGGYTALGDTHNVTFYKISVEQFLQGFFGQLVSPSRGIFVFSPITIYFIPGAWQLFREIRISKDERLILSLTLAAIALFFSYCFYTIWWAGGSYGPRFLTDVLPISCYLIGYWADYKIKIFAFSRKSIVGLAIFLMVLLFSTLTQVVGTFGKADWSGFPINVSEYTARLWDWRDSELTRNTNSLLFQLAKPVEDLNDYSRFLEGAVEKVEEITLNQFSPFGRKKNEFSSTPRLNKTVVLRAKLRNIGQSKWFGYKSGITVGETRVRLRIFNSENIQVDEARLFISSSPKLNETAIALGSVKLPEEGGLYRMVFDFVAEGIGEFPSNSKHVPYQMSFSVTSQGSPNSHRSFSQTINLLTDIKSLKSNTQLKLPIRLRNSSDFPWSSIGSAPVFLSYRWINAQGNIIVRNGERTPLPFKILPNNGAVVNAFIETPSTPGNYILRLTMVQEGVAWFDEKGAKTEDIAVAVVGE